MALLHPDSEEIEMVIRGGFTEAELEVFVALGGQVDEDQRVPKAGNEEAAS